MNNTQEEESGSRSPAGQGGFDLRIGEFSTQRSTGHDGVTLGSTEPHIDYQTFFRTKTELENSIRRLHEELYVLRTKLINQETERIVKENALTKISIQGQEIAILKQLAEENEKWREQAESLTQELDRIRAHNEDLGAENRLLRAERLEMLKKVDHFSALIDLKDSEIRQLKQNNARLKKKLMVLSGGDHSDTEHRGRFRRESLRDCQRCHAEMSRSVCQYHPKLPLKLPNSEEFYFPCCQQTGRHVPQGCKIDVHHVEYQF